MNWDSRTGEHCGDVPSSTSSGLLKGAQSGNREAWTRLVGLYGPTVYRWCRHRGVGADDAPDVCQEVFATVASGLGQFHRDQDGDSFRGWLWTITYSKVQDHFRRRAGQPNAQGGSEFRDLLAALPGSDPGKDSSSGSDPPQPPPADRADLQRLLDSLCGEFEPASLQAFWRIVVQGHSSADVARDLGLTPSAVRQAKYRILRRLRRELGG